MRYGVTDQPLPTGAGSEIVLWSGPWHEIYEASGKARQGAKSITLTDYNRDKFRVVLPEGVTFPRTAENFIAIDAAISEAYEAHNARLGRIQVGRAA